MASVGEVKAGVAAANAELTKSMGAELAVNEALPKFYPQAVVDAAKDVAGLLGSLRETAKAEIANAQIIGGNVDKTRGAFDAVLEGTGSVEVAKMGDLMNAAKQKVSDGPEAITHMLGGYEQLMADVGALVAGTTAKLEADARAQLSAGDESTKAFVSTGEHVMANATAYVANL